MPIASAKGSPCRFRSPDYPRTFPDTLWRTANDFGERGVSIWNRSATKSGRKTYAELYAEVERAVGQWQAAGVSSGDRILLSLPTGWSFLTAWLGAICLGAYPSAIAPASGGMGASRNYTDKLEAYRNVVGATKLLAQESLVKELREKAPDSLGPMALSPEELESEEPAGASLGKPDAQDIAFMQFTSGSTGMPRAVKISHAMATHNAAAAMELLSRRYDTPVSEWSELYSSWLPLHHDMGLVGCLLLSIANGLELSLMNPTTFLARPLNYLRSLHGKRCITVGPNFGYQFCADRLKPGDLSGIDLSKPSVAMCGSEMIRPETIRAFCDLTEEAGFQEGYFMPGYGMAEATLIVSYDARGLGARTEDTPASPNLPVESQKVVCCGEPIPDTEIQIWDNGGEVLQEGEIGEVAVKGPSIIDGYYENKQATQRAKRGDWLLTGDLGFLKGRELYLVGRLKEILIIRGENVMPHELEWLVEEVRESRGGGESSAAFSVNLGHAEEEVVLIVETGEQEAEKLAGFEQAIRSRIGLALSLTIAELQFVRRGSLPRTSSGKIQRSKVKQEYLEAKLPLP